MTIMFSFILFIVHDFHNINNNPLFDKNNDMYFDYLHSMLEEHFDIKPQVLNTSNFVKNLILVQLESYPYEFIKKAFVSPNLKNLTEKYEFIYPIYAENFAGHSLSATTLLQTGIPMIFPDITWNDRVKEYKFMNGFQGLPNILYAYNYTLEFASTTSNEIMGFRKWCLSHKYNHIYVAKNDIYLYNFFTEKYLDILDKRARESKFKNHSLTFIYNIDTHSPYHRPRWCKLIFPPEIEEGEKCFHCVDKVLGRFIQKFLDLKMYEHTLLVVFPDHPPYHLTQKELYILFPGVNKSNYIKNYKGDFSYYDFAPTILDLIGIKKYVPEFIYGKNIYDPTLFNQPICINETCFPKRRRPDSNDLTIIYKYLHFEKGKSIKRRYYKEKQFVCRKENKNGNITIYYQDMPC